MSVGRLVTELKWPALWIRAFSVLVLAGVNMVVWVVHKQQRTSIVLPEWCHSGIVFLLIFSREEP